MPEAPIATLTFLFTDIEGSTRLWEQAPEAMRSALARHDAILRQAIQTYHGQVFKTMGDAFCAAFTAPSDAIAAALAAQQAVIRSLPGAQQEAEAIRALFPGSAIYTGKAAQESVVIKEAGKYKYLHFATHGFFNDAAPLLSCIVLAQPPQGANNTVDATENKAAVVPVAALATNTPPVNALAVNAPVAAAGQAQAEDGLLTARKVFGLHLNADLVTLSACNSGRGQVRTGEGIVGLTWAFFAAGCPAQVVSQWSVDDAATGQLMTTFYAGLKQGKSKSAALRAAALKLSKDGKHRHPYYWTPFFLVGDWR